MSLTSPEPCPPTVAPFLLQGAGVAAAVAAVLPLPPTAVPASPLAGVYQNTSLIFDATAPPPPAPLNLSALNGSLANATGAPLPGSPGGRRLLAAGASALAGFNQSSPVVHAHSRLPPSWSSDITACYAVGDFFKVTHRTPPPTRPGRPHLPLLPCLDPPRAARRGPCASDSLSLCGRVGAGRWRTSVAAARTRLRSRMASWGARTISWTPLGGRRGAWRSSSSAGGAPSRRQPAGRLATPFWRPQPLHHSAECMTQNQYIFAVDELDIYV